MRTETLLLASSPEAEQEVLSPVLRSHNASNKNHTRPLPRFSFPQPKPSSTWLKKDKALIQSVLCENQHRHEAAKSWRAPVIMLSSLLSAIVLAILHDTMNRSLNGNIVNLDGPWNQQWTSRYGTALAFLIKMLFVTCVGTAFVQGQWLDLSTRQQTLRVRNLDVLLNALSTPFSLISSLMWLRNPLLSMVAVISWFETGLTNV